MQYWSPSYCRSVEFVCSLCVDVGFLWFPDGIDEHDGAAHASVCCSLVLFLFLFVCPVLSNDFLISFTRNNSLDIE